VSDLRRRVAEHYSAQAESFAAYWAPILRQMSGALLPDLPLGGARRVLDVGTGTGGLIPALRAAAPSAAVFGADLSEGMLAVNAADTAAPLAVMAAEELAFANECVDVVVFTFVLHRLPRPAEALREAARVLRRGGAVGVVTWGAGGRAGAADRIWHDELDALGLPPEPRAPAFHAIVDSPERLDLLLRDAGFAATRAWPRAFERGSTRDEWLMFQLNRADRARLGTLAPERRGEFERRVRARIHALPPEEFTSRSEAVFGLGYTGGHSS
jgi:SAM-dependent methyltransferase